MNATYNRTEREAFACLQHGRQTLAQIFASGGMTTVDSGTLRHALNELIKGGLVRHIRGPWRQSGHWELLPGAVMPPGDKLRALPADLPPQRILHQRGDVPPQIWARLGLGGLVRQMTEQP